MSTKLLIIDDDIDLCHLLSRFLSKNGYEVETAYSGNKGLTKYKADKYDAVIADYRLGDMDGVDLVRALRQYDDQAAILVITGYSEVKPAVEVIKLGAFDYISKPLIPEEVLSILNRIVNRPERDPDDAPTTGRTAVTDDGEDCYIGKSLPTLQLYRQVEVVAATRYSVILYGESGTGKEVIARSIHRRSQRASGPFVALDCGTLSRELAGSELFGHIKGSFTGAIQDKEGHFELANGGTLFLDEIGNLSPEIQAALLRVIQERKFKRIGSNKELLTDVRIIVASNEDLRQACQNGKFREDLYHRLNEFSIDLPPLRERREDIRPLADFFLQKCCEENEKTVDGFNEEVYELFQNYAWPGNLRELKNMIRRAILLTPERATVDRTVLPHEIRETEPEVAGEQGATTDLLKKAAGRAEYQTIMSVLQKVNFNKKKAAEVLNIDRKTLYNKLKPYE
ncbi:sigma-54-dependent transcriptional regulator [Niabella beijingensis]|uniref:sigma-54-dependent transcriptional regulator n=1 Tax=Niabella beijingensis TaxID=2872700 RepID=UPI001CBF65EF|nr:sigma-54 dependent transcriptional regulator [Niabella beijingensis]MBZ4190941.1 sigma-54 dependent transcriptional regulator [Niabella beijingensis]